MKKILIVLITALLFVSACEIMPRNTLGDCRDQCKDSKKSKACIEFCDCIHKQGLPLDTCLDKYNKAPSDDARKQ
jgi:hypothetical protein